MALKTLEDRLRHVALISCAALTLVTVMTIITRMVHVPFYVANELNGSFMIVLVFLALPYVTRKRQHLWVEFFWDFYPPRFKRVVAVIIDITVCLYLVLLTYLCTNLALSSWADGTRAQGMWRIPLVYAQGCMAVGLAVSTVTQVALTFGRFTHGPRAS